MSVEHDCGRSPRQGYRPRQKECRQCVASILALELAEEFRLLGDKVGWAVAVVTAAQYEQLAKSFDRDTRRHAALDGERRG
jgi:hypothetical protein